MSLTSIVILTMAGVYAMSFVYRVLRLVWRKGSLGQEVYPDEVIGILGRDLWTILKLPYVVIATILNRKT